MRLLIVDDEKHIRDGMKAYITKQQNKITHIETAKDADEAINISKVFQPDMLISDVVMPSIDGIELASRLQFMYPKLKIVMISGFKEIKYLKSAMKLGAIDFILKPIDLSELNLVLDKVVSTLVWEFREREEMVSLKDEFNEAINALREKFLSSCLTGEMIESEDITNKIKTLHIHLDEKMPMVVVNVQLDQVNIANSADNARMVKDVIDSSLREFGLIAVLHRSSTEIIAITNTDSSFLQEFCRQICERIQTQFKVTISIGIGTETTHLQTLFQSYLTSLEAVNQRFIRGAGKVILFRRPNTLEYEEELSSIKSHRDELLLLLQTGDIGRVQSSITQMLSPFYQWPFISTRMIQEIKLELITLITQITRELNHPISYKLDLGELLLLSTLQRVEEYLITSLSILCDFLFSQRKKKSAILIEKIIEITESRFHEPLNVQYVADCMKISPNYLSTLFKQEKRINYMDYLTKIRLDKSLDMILHSPAQIKDIANAVGYLDANYFSTIFKKYFGKTPSQYREVEVN